MKVAVTLLWLWICASPVIAQYDHESVFSSLDDDELYQSLRDNFRPTNLQSYGDARDLLYGDIDLENDTLTCVYTGYKIYISSDVDPSSDAFSQGINTEHTIPRSKGADDFLPGYRDMHHLFPTVVEVNTARGSLPFAEINDNQTDTWFIGQNETSAIPPAAIRDQYSEYHQNVAFEPREDHKGNVARAYFYFYTMHRTDMELADPEFFESQRETMCDWHFLDPVDKKEWNRSKDIAAEQGNENPFVLDCSLARLYCDELDQVCLSVDTEETQIDKINIASTGAGLIVNGHKKGSKLILFSVEGSVVLTTSLNYNSALVDISHLPTGIFVASVITDNEVHSTRIIR